MPSFYGLPWWCVVWFQVSMVALVFVLSRALDQIHPDPGPGPDSAWLHQSSLTHTPTSVHCPAGLQGHCHWGMWVWLLAHGLNSWVWLLAYGVYSWVYTCVGVCVVYSWVWLLTYDVHSWVCMCVSVSVCLCYQEKLSDVLEVEEVVNSSFCLLVVKMSEAAFRPAFLQVSLWQKHWFGTLYRIGGKLVSIKFDETAKNKRNQYCQISIWHLVFVSKAMM